MESSQEILQQERVDTKARLAKLAEIGKPILEQTALIQEKDFTEEDVVKVREFFEASKTIAHPKVWSAYWDHIDLTGKYARILGEKLKTKGVHINPYELEVLGMIHDIGRLISPHRLFRTNLVGESLLKKFGVRENLRSKQIPEARFFGKGEEITSPDQLTTEQQILMLADNLGRRVEDGSLIRLNQIGNLTYQQVERYPGEVFTSERFGKRRLVQASEKEFKILDEISQALQIKYGISIDDIREEVAGGTQFKPK